MLSVDVVVDAVVVGVAVADAVVDGVGVLGIRIQIGTLGILGSVCGCLNDHPSWIVAGCGVRGENTSV